MLRQKKQKIESEGRQILNAADRYFEGSGIVVNKVLRKGSPADIICDYADSNDFDLIVLGVRGKDGIKRYLMGSIADKVMRHANTSVMIVK